MLNAQDYRLLPFPDPQPLIDDLLALPAALKYPREGLNTFLALNRARQRALRIPDFDIDRDRYVILSDAHRGDRKRGSDEFQVNERLYCDALDYYYREDYRLVLNGDIEEGWKSPYSRIIDAYADTAYRRERAFADRGEGYYLRTWGNHDIDWASPRLVDQLLSPFFGRRMQVHPAILLGDKVLITHGHQGDFNSDKLIWLSRRVIKHFWQPLQRLFAIQWRRAAVNHLISSKRDHLLSAWGKANRMLVIAGHTHRPLLQFDDVHAEPPTPDVDLGSRLHYVNDGCCIHKRAITGIEIDRGEIRLIRWQKQSNRQLARQGSLTERVIFQRNDLGALLGRL